MSPNTKALYAQSSDIKARSYLEYRRDMKKKAIAELEVLPWVEAKLQADNLTEPVSVTKSGGDRFLWFLRSGGISRAPDFVARIGKTSVDVEFQYADRTDLNYYDFKVSKVTKKKGQERLPIEGKVFFYIHKPLLACALFEPDWVTANGEIGMVPAWRDVAYRVPRERFHSLLEMDPTLEPLCRSIDAKNFVLAFQHHMLENSNYSGRLGPGR